MTNHISTLIKSLRAGPIRLTQSQIALQTGILQPRISRWENGRDGVFADDVLRLVEFAKKNGIDFDGSKMPISVVKRKYNKHIKESNIDSDELAELINKDA